MPLLMLRLQALCLGLFLLALPGLGAAATVTDATGRSVALPDQIERILPAGPPAAVLLYTLAPGKMLGWPHAPSDAARALLDKPAADLPEIGALSMGGTVDTEKLRRLHPDLILDIGTVAPRYVALAEKVQAETGVPYLLLDGGLAQSAGLYRRLGPLLGEAERGAALAAAAERILGDLARAVAARPAGATALRAYYGRGADGLTTGPSSALNVEILKLLGLANVADEAAAGGGLAKVTPAQLLAWNPAVILTSSPGFAAALAHDPAWAGLAAVRDGRVLAAPGLPFGWADEPPGVNRLLGLAWAGHLLYPAALPEDPRLAARAFYHLFYRVELDDAALDRLLAPAAPSP